MTFSDVIDKFGADIKQDQLEYAYGRAGSAFTGQMCQNFVVMRENGVSGGGRGRTEWQARGRGGGRGRGEAQGPASDVQ